MTQRKAKATTEKKTQKTWKSVDAFLSATYKSAIEKLSAIKENVKSQFKSQEPVEGFDGIFEHDAAGYGTIDKTDILLDATDKAGDNKIASAPVREYYGIEDAVRFFKIRTVDVENEETLLDRIRNLFSFLTTRESWHRAEKSGEAASERTLSEKDAAQFVVDSLNAQLDIYQRALWRPTPERTGAGQIRQRGIGRLAASGLAALCEKYNVDVPDSEQEQFDLLIELSIKEHGTQPAKK